MVYVIYPIKTYRQATAKFIANNCVSFDKIEDLSNELVTNNQGYHSRISKNDTYIFFGDIDNYEDNFDVFAHKLIVFLKNRYILHLDIMDIRYTKNNTKNGSYHFSIPCFNLSIKKMKEIMCNMINFYPGDFSYNKDGKTWNCIDTSIYSDHWFRFPYQSKGIDGDKSEHIIVNGNIEDFVVSYIPDASTNIEYYEYYDEAKFDNKWWLLGFKNKVFDLNEGCIRDYRHDDNVSITTGYNWREPTQEELNTVNGIIEKIMPYTEERKLYLQILCSALDGKCLDKFIIFNGKGNNGKGLINELLLKFLGDYGMVGDNSLLFEGLKTNINKKRLVILREFEEDKKIKISVIRELTGGYNLSNTKKEINLTLILESNHKPLLSNTPTKSDVEGLIDLKFTSVFTNKLKEVNPEKHIYLANNSFATLEFQEKHKFAIGKILMEAYREYAKNNFELDIPDTVAERTLEYLELSDCKLKKYQNYYVISKDKNNKIDILIMLCIQIVLLMAIFITMVNKFFIQ
jgi:hypothetical protein